MTPQFPRRTHRAREAMLEVGRRYPDAWDAADRMRQDRGNDLPSWPDYCYLPMHGAYAIVSGGGDVAIGRARDIAVVGALATWRMTQGIYRYDPDLYAALIETPIDGEIPADTLRRLPEWCVYVETPGVRFVDQPVAGAWVHMDWDQRGWDEIRILLDLDPPSEDWSHLVGVPLVLDAAGGGDLAGALRRLDASAAREAAAAGKGSLRPVAPDIAALRPTLAPILSLALYLASVGAEMSGRRGAPENPEPKRTRHGGWRLFAADGPTTWDVGVRLGAALRAARDAESSEHGERGRHVRGHVRRAHWHTYLTGPRAGEQRRELRWLPPIPVALDDLGELPSTIRPVH